MDAKETYRTPPTQSAVRQTQRDIGAEQHRTLLLHRLAKRASRGLRMVSFGAKSLGSEWE